MPLHHHHKNAWIISVNMGYGHERAAFGLERLAHGGVITANAYPGIPERDRMLWMRTRRVYETISRLRPVPVIGPVVFGLMDYFQKIPDFYPRRDLSFPIIQLREIYRLIEHDGLGRHLIQKLSKKRLPLVTTFFLPAFAAEVHGYPGDIYVVLCDADISRAWAPLDPKKSRIRYFAPNGRVVERLKLYGVPEAHIFLTGFPLPPELIGGPDSPVLKKDLSDRLCHLDPNGIFLGKYGSTLEQELGPNVCWKRHPRPFTVTFSVGGAGAQKQIGFDLVQSLRKKILRGAIRINLEAGTNTTIAEEFRDHAIAFGLKRAFGSTLFIHRYDDRRTYFRAFAKTLRTTDVLWTKPSELSFYTGLGIPIIMAPPIGSQEEFNRIWLKTVNGGITQNDPRYADEWLFDWINSGGLARFAWSGYVEAPTHGAYRIESILTGESVPLAKLPLIV